MGPAGGYFKYVTTPKILAPRCAPTSHPWAGQGINPLIARWQRDLGGPHFGKHGNPRAQDGSYEPV